MSSGKSIPLDKGSVVTYLSRVALGTRMISSGTLEPSTVRQHKIIQHGGRTCGKTLQGFTSGTELVFSKNSVMQIQF